MKPEDIPAPLKLQKVKCHCCREFVDVVALPDLTSRMYFPKEKENDQHVMVWEWKNPAFGQIRPSHFDIFFCPKCLYADLREEFGNPELNPSNKVSVLREKFLEEAKKKDSLIALFAKNVDMLRMDFRVAVFLHFLAILAQEVLFGPAPHENPRLSRDWRKLARLYLRAAWIFREENPEKGGARQEESRIYALRGAIDDLLKTVTLLKTNLEEVVSKMDLQQRSDEEKKVYKKDIYLNYKASLQHIVGHFAQVRNSSVRLKENNDAHIKFVSSKTPVLGERFYALREELMGFSDRWPDIPTGEVDCLKKSAEYFRLAADNDRYLSDIEGLKMLEFAVMLLHRAGLKEDLSEMYKVFMRRGSDIRTAYQKKKMGTKSMVDAAMFDTEINKINKIIEDVSYTCKHEKGS